MIEWVLLFVYLGIGAIISFSCGNREIDYGFWLMVLLWPSFIAYVFCAFLSELNDLTNHGVKRDELLKLRSEFEAFKLESIQKERVKLEEDELVNELIAGIENDRKERG